MTPARPRRPAVGVARRPTGVASAGTRRAVRRASGPARGRPAAPAQYVAASRAWSTIARARAKPADAFVYHRAGAGHIFLLDRRNSAGNLVTLECKGCSPTGACARYVRSPSSVGSAYKVIQRANLSPDAVVTEDGAAEVTTL